MSRLTHVSTFGWFGPTGTGGGGGTPINVPALAVSDNEDGTGGVATVSGATSGTNNKLYKAVVDNGEPGGYDWVLVGQRTGNGTIAIGSSHLGYHWWQVVSTDGSYSEPSNLVYQPLTDGEASIHDRCLLAVQARLQQLTFATPDSGDPLTLVALSKLVIDHPKYRPAMPCIVVGITGRETIKPVTNASDEVEYPVVVCIFAKDDQDLAKNRATYTKWREQITRALNMQRLAGVTEVLTCTVVPSTIIPIPNWKDGILASGMQVNCRAWQGRGLT